MSSCSTIGAHKAVQRLSSELTPRYLPLDAASIAFSGSCATVIRRPIANVRINVSHRRSLHSTREVLLTFWYSFIGTTTQGQIYATVNPDTLCNNAGQFNRVSGLYTAVEPDATPGSVFYSAVAGFRTAGAGPSGIYITGTSVVMVQPPPPPPPVGSMRMKARRDRIMPGKELRADWA